MHTLMAKHARERLLLYALMGLSLATSDYNMIGNAGNWIKFDKVTGVPIDGGTFDGQGAGIWACKTSGKNFPKGITLQGVKVLAPRNSPNTDGIHVKLSSGVSIMNSHIGTGDDCISIGPGNSNLWIEDIACGPGHGISIGSLGWKLQEPGVQNVTIKTVTFTGTTNENLGKA
ncbi:hypothetical protein RND71_034101 [Anisodus tanguticus]|uniref:Uncharacterized protein n=1 Tax=Anisodus tanguticus TaxID=243964 RepID=A0AAE1RC20_9SOLA|nr:hypothetical protein RND71_034101 [Anisodus tanguticus]